MITRLNAWVLGALALATSMSAGAANELCDSLHTFVSSVGVQQAQELKFRVIVGSNFKDREGTAYGARRCDYAGFEPAKALCKYLMENSSIESAGANAKSVIACVSPKTKFAPGTWVYAISFAAKVGTETRGTRVDVVLTEDKEVGGMLLAVKATGY